MSMFHANKGKHLVFCRSVVCDSEEGVQVGVGVLGVCFGWSDVN